MYVEFTKLVEMVSKKAARGKKLEPGKGDQLITNFFPRTKRIPAAVKRDEDLRRIHYHLDHGDPEEGFEVVTFEGKGKGVVTTRCFNKGDFVVEYAGELLTYKEAMVWVLCTCIICISYPDLVFAGKRKRT